MTQLVKPSELPENTVIDESEHGKFIKETKDLWIQVHPQNGEHPDFLTDHGFENKDYGPSNLIVDKSDDYFKDFEIVSVPQGWYPPYVDKVVTAWYDLANLRAVRKTIIYEIIEDDGTLREEDLATAPSSPITWRDIPSNPNYETCVGWDNEVYVRKKKSKRYKTRNKSGFFILYKKGERDWWCEGELGTLNQIRHFYKTGEVGADV
jgi:hypothetical protein